MRDHTTIQAETYDQIALTEYGDDLATREMMAENGTRDPRLLAVWRFDYGVALEIPDRSPDAATVETLPEYRRPPE